MLGFASPTFAATSLHAWWEPLEVFPKPPANFSPLTATNQELTDYGFPPRPSGSVALKSWTWAMEHAKYWEAPHPSPGTTPISEPRSSYGSANVPWSGYAVTSSQNNNDVYDNVSAQWIQPSVSADSNYPNSDYETAPCDAFWVGIGGQTGDSVVQAGVSSISTNTAQYRFWTEDYPNNPIYEGPVIVPGQAAFVTITYYGNGTANYWLENASTGTYQSFRNNAPYYDGSSAEFIVEKHVYPPRFSSESFSQAYVMYNNESGSDALWAQNSTRDVMTDTNGNTQVYPGAINSNIDGFSENWVTSN